MKTYIGLWDGLFGEKIKIEVPLPNGGIKKVTVTKKWLEKMVREGKITKLPPSIVKVNIFDPVGGLMPDKFQDPTEFFDVLEGQKNDYCIGYWTIGKQLPEEQYQKFVDLETKELYGLRTYNDGKPRIHLVQKELWEAIKKV